MMSNMLYRILMLGLCIPATVLLVACSDERVHDDAGLSRAEVEEMVQAAIEDLPDTQSGLTSNEAEDIARSVLASTPPRSALAEYTKHLVDNAISFYETRGLDAAVAHYNREESVDGQWYVYIVGGDGMVVGHPEAERRGLNLRGWVGTDSNGYNFGPEMLSATEDGKWVSYVYRNPESGRLGSGDFELKNVWVVRRDGLLFASGWYINADEFTKKLVSLAVESFRAGGLPEAVAYFADPGSAVAGLEAAVAYYNTAGTVDGTWSAFIADDDGQIVAYSDPGVVGSHLEEVFGAGTISGSGEGRWMESESMRIWVAGYDGYSSSDRAGAGTGRNDWRRVAVPWLLSGIPFSHSPIRHRRPGDRGSGRAGQRTPVSVPVIGY